MMAISSGFRGSKSADRRAIGRSEPTTSHAVDRSAPRAEFSLCEATERAERLGSGDFCLQQGGEILTTWRRANRLAWEKCCSAAVTWRLSHYREPRGLNTLAGPSPMVAKSPVQVTTRYQATRVCSISAVPQNPGMIPRLAPEDGGLFQEAWRD